MGTITGVEPVNPQLCHHLTCTELALFYLLTRVAKPLTTIETRFIHCIFIHYSHTDQSYDNYDSSCTSLMDSLSTNRHPCPCPCPPPQCGWTSPEPRGLLWTQSPQSSHVVPRGPIVLFLLSSSVFSVWIPVPNCRLFSPQSWSSLSSRSCFLPCLSSR